MAVLVYAESQNGKIKKSSREAVYYGKLVADILQTECTALTLGLANDASELGKYGASKVLNVDTDALSNFDSGTYSIAIAEAANQINANTIILAHSSSGKSILGRLSVRMKAGSISGVVSLPTLDGGFKVKKNVFSGKAIAECLISSPTRVLTLSGNSFKPQEIAGPCTVETIEILIPTSKIKVIDIKREEGIVPLPEAEIVVSAGRGMKGPENWGIIEQLAETLNATTACSRPVADIGWRPHHEHVGQTGVAIKPNLYIAAGISGAIQHLAGVNSSKVIVVINKDAEAPFFKAADYGVLGDLFEVVPKLTAALQKFKSSN